MTVMDLYLFVFIKTKDTLLGYMLEHVLLTLITLGAY